MPLQMLTFRAGVATIINVVYLNWELKFVMVDSVKLTSSKALFLRVAISAFTIILSYSALKYFSVTTVSVFSNFSPFMVLLIGGCFCAETVTKS